MTLFVRRFSKFLKKGGFDKSNKYKSNYNKSKPKNVIVDCPQKKDKEDGEGDKTERRHKKEHKKKDKAQAHVGEVWDSNESSSNFRYYHCHDFHYNKKEEDS